MNRNIRKLREQRIRRSRSRISGTASKPRLTVFRSNKSVHVQLIDDIVGNTLASVSPKEIPSKKGGTKVSEAEAAGKLIAEKAKKAGISEAVFDKRFYKYHGRIKAVADGAREGGLKI